MWFENFNKEFRKRTFQIVSVAGLLFASYAAMALPATIGGKNMECEACENDTTTCCPMEADAGGNINCFFVGSCVGAGIEDPPAGQQVQPPLIGPSGSGPRSGGGLFWDGTRVSLNQYDFGNQFVNTQASSPTILFTSFRASLDQISVTTDNNEFKAQTNCNSTLQARGSCNIWVDFIPTATGARNGVLTINYYVPLQNNLRVSGRNAMNIPLTGNGIPGLSIPGAQIIPPVPPNPRPYRGSIRPGDFGNCSTPGNDACTGNGPRVGPNPPPLADPLPIPNKCGNGILEVGEECDDGNNIDGDGCCAKCTEEDVITPSAVSTPNPMISGGGCSLSVAPSAQATSLLSLLPFGLVAFARVYRKK